MQEALTCPDERSLRNYLDGLLSDRDAEPIEQHLTQFRACWDSLELLLAGIRRDLRVAAVQEPASAPPDLIQRLLRLRTEAMAPETADAPASVPTLPPLETVIPPQFGRYQVRRKLGSGGMGIVYEAHDPHLDRAVALKVPHFEGQPERQTAARQRFVREARAAARVRHPHICPIYDVGEQNGQPYVVLALVEGGSLADRLRTHGRMTDDAATVRLVLQVAGALAELHGHGILHRDLKPGNILLDCAGVPLLTDFGLARFVEDAETVTVAGAIVGTPAYMAPEQATPALGPVTPQSDLYNLGVVLYQLLTGRLPFQGTPLQIVQQLANTAVPPATQFRPDLDPSLADILAKALARRPADRYSDAAAFAHALSDWLSGPTRTIPPVPVSPHKVATGKPVPGPAAMISTSRRRALFGIAGAAPALLAIGYYWLTLTGPTPTTDSGPAPYRGWVDVVVWDAKDPARQRRGLSELGTLPLKPGDQVRLEAEVQPAAFLYLLWIDTEGVATPIYPWRGTWKTGPVLEEPRTRLSFPEEAGKAATIPPMGHGMETVVLLACDRALNVDLEPLLKGLPPQRPWQNERAAVWFQNGEIVTTEPDRAPQFFENLQEINDPVLRVQQLLKEKVQPHVRFSRAVSFAKKGQPVGP
jgi:hypothetical protein